MQNKTLALLTTAILASTTAGTALAEKKQTTYSDYARVTNVQPIYRVVTVREPQRQCEFVRPQRRHRHNDHTHSDDHNRRRNQRYFTSGESYGETNRTTDSSTASAVVIGGVIGGAISHHVTRAVNGKSDPAITLAGAVVGSALANSAARRQQGSQNPGNDSDYKTNYAVDDNSDYKHRRRNNHRRNNDRRSWNNSRRHNQRGYERCWTTTVSREERRQDGYNVTYTYRGNTFQTRTDQHPGRQIRVRVQIRPH